MQLSSLLLTNWKSFGDDRNQVDFAPLTLLVGPNASGKSNVLEALRFLQGAAFDYPLGEVLRGRYEGQREVWPPIRGQDVEAVRLGADYFGLLTRWRFDSSMRDLQYGIGVETADDVSLRREFINVGVDDGSRDGFRAMQHEIINSALQVAGGGPPEGKYNGRRSVLGQEPFKRKASPDLVALASSLRTSLRELVFLDILPARMRDYRSEHAVVLGSSAENISPILARLDDVARQDVVDWLGELCAPTIDEIFFDRTQLKEVLFFVVENGRKVSARSVSDGTLRFLGLVTALLTVPEGSIILIEEPDVGLHPSRVHLLARLLEQVTSRRNLQIVATTHSPMLLAHLQPESLGNVVALGRDDQGRSVSNRLRDLEHYSTLRDSKQLDHLVSTGWIERAL